MAVAGVMNVIPFFVMARPDIRRIEDLKGKKIGITRFGSASDFALRYTEEKVAAKARSRLRGHPERQHAGQVCWRLRAERSRRSHDEHRVLRL